MNYKDNRNRNINIRCNEEQYNEIKRRSKELGLSQADYIIMKALDLRAVDKLEEKEYTVKVKGKEYTQKRYTKKKVLESIAELVEA